MLRTYGRRTFDFSRRTAVMAILNRTPDSFYDRGATYGFGAAVEAGERALAEGADWLDVGGVKGGPGAPVTEAEELDRVVPLLEALRGRTDAVLSVDTYRPGVARQALAAGADVVNDPSGLRDPAMAEVAAEAGAGLVVMHTGGPPRTRPHRPAYADVVAEVRAFLAARAALAMGRGLPASATRCWSPSPTRTSSARPSTSGSTSAWRAAWPRPRSVWPPGPASSASTRSSPPSGWSAWSRPSSAAAPRRPPAGAWPRRSRPGSVRGRCRAGTPGRPRPGSAPGAWPGRGRCRRRR